MLARAQPRLPDRLVCGDLRALPLRTGSLDGVWSSYALLHLDDAGLQTAFAEVARVLRSGGTAAVLLASEGDGEQVVPYAEDRTRWFFTRDLDVATATARAVGLEVLDADVVPDATRAPIRLLLRR
jgi:SAM-dependent methyltransferase